MKYSNSDIKKSIAKTYKDIALSDASCGCCGGDDARVASNKTLAKELGYTDDDLDTIPANANMGLGCGNPIVSAHIALGDVVLDLGSGLGIDCFLAAQKTGSTGTVIGVDMTPEMIERARGNAQNNLVKNVEFRLGEIECLPVETQSVDIAISNCVINLVTDKEPVFEEIFRVLKPGGRVSISDIVAAKPLSDKLKNDLSSYGSCISGAISVAAYKAFLKQAGFGSIDIHLIETSQHYISKWVNDDDDKNYIVSAQITAVKPQEKKS